MPPVKRSHGAVGSVTVNGKQFSTTKYSWGHTLGGVRPHGVDPKAVGTHPTKAGLVSAVENHLKAAGLWDDAKHPRSHGKFV